MKTVRAEVDRNAALLDWYAGNDRDLPWRGSKDPYRTLVAEVMSQQTQAERAATHFLRFVDEFPTIHALATAPFAAVAAAWSGLGFNSRAKRLHLAAKHVSATGWPRTYAELLGLPGVGPYTAAAVACFAFGEQRPAIDTNLRRVLSRWHGEALHGAALLTAATESISTDAAAWNQAVMDLGALHCRPRNPRCSSCPVAVWCSGPETYEPPRTQGRFVGSSREARGAVMRIIARKPASADHIASTCGIEIGRIQTAVAALTDEGLVAQREDGSLAVVD